MDPLIFERSLHGMVIVDDERRVHDVNMAACVMVQRPRELVLGRRIEDFTARPALPALEVAMDELLRTGHQAGNWPVLTGDGRVIEVEYSSLARAVAGRHLMVFVVRRIAEPPPGEPSPAGGPGLTAREGEVLRLLALGCTGPEVAERMGVGVDTVRTYIRSLKRKLGARTLPHLIALAMSDAVRGAPHN